MKKYRKIAEKRLGRKLLSTEDVHHKDLDPSNDAPSNLEVLPHGEHTRLHHTGLRHSPSTKKKIRKALLGRKLPQKTRKKMHLTQSRRPIHPFSGKRHSLKTRKKMSRKHKGVPKGPCSEKTKQKMRKALLEFWKKRRET